MEIELKVTGYVSKIACKPGDVVLVKIDKMITNDQLGKLRSHVKSVFRENKVMILCGGVEIEIVEATH